MTGGGDGGDQDEGFHARSLSATGIAVAHWPKVPVWLPVARVNWAEFPDTG